MKPDVLVLAPLAARQMAQLEAHYTLHRHDLAQDKDAFLAAHGPSCAAIVTNGGTALTAAMLAHLPKLKLVGCVTAGYEAIEVAALTRHGAVLTNTSGPLADDVADMAIFLMTAARRDAMRAHEFVRSGDWGREGNYPLKQSNSGKRLGIVGMGVIGKAIVARAEPMNMQIRYFSRHAKPEVAHEFVPDLLALATWADILVVIVAGGAGTRHLIDAQVLAALGPEGTLVNVARGSVVDEPALIAALKSGTIANAGLDVFASEPDADPALTGLPNVVVQPHHASATVATRDAMAQNVVDNLAAFYAGRPLLTPVN
jgi:lactate dehydrogenase-like 2-hydroxyacid dehydrogenase